MNCSYKRPSVVATLGICMNYNFLYWPRLSNQSLSEPRNLELNSLRTDWTDEPSLSIWTSIQAVNFYNCEGHFALGMSSRPFEGLGVVLNRLGGTVLVSSYSSTMGVSGGNSDGEGSLEPVDGMAMSNLVISANSASESEAKSDSFTDVDSESEDSTREVKCSKGTKCAIYCWLGWLGCLSLACGGFEAGGVFTLDGCLRGVVEEDGTKVEACIFEEDWNNL